MELIFGIFFVLVLVFGFIMFVGARREKELPREYKSGSIVPSTVSVTNSIVSKETIRNCNIDRVSTDDCDEESSTDDRRTGFAPGTAREIIAANTSIFDTCSESYSSSSSDCGGSDGGSSGSGCE